MTPLISKTICKIYLMLALLVGILLSPFLYSIIALTLFILHAYSFYKPPRAGLSLGLTILTLLILPLTLQSSAGMLSALVIIPAMPLLGHNLKENALKQPFPHLVMGREPTVTLKALATTLLLVLIVSLILANWTLSLAVGLLVGYLVGVLVYILRKIPKVPLKESKTWVRAIVGNIAKTSVTIKGRARIPLYVSLSSPYPWVRLDPLELRLEGDEAELNLAITPPLAGPSKLQIQALSIDPWGLNQMSQTIEPVELYVIPRARYAEWLARKYLEQTQPGVGFAAIAPSSGMPKAARQGVEYHNSRLYQPGDSLKDIDWKHTAKLSQLVVKEYSEARAQVAIIAVNLAVKDPEEADRLTYNLITLALTLARESIPSTLAAYSHEEVLATIPLLNPREMLKKTLKLSRSISLFESAERFLQPLDIQRLRRTITQLEQAKIEPAQKLKQLLQIEYEAIQEGVEDHPATRALTQMVKKVPPPAVIAMVSLWNHDAQALLVTLDKLKRRGYRVIPVEIR